MKFFFEKLLLMMFLLFAGNIFAQTQVNVIPYPQKVKLTSASYLLKENYKIQSNKDLNFLANLLVNDTYILTGIKGQIVKKGGEIILKTDKQMSDESYRLEIYKNKILLIGKDYNSVAMGVTTLLQLIKTAKNDFIIPCCNIEDSPNVKYRGLMVDVARQWVELQSLRQCVDLCNWYKIKYLHIHFCDDQSFTFPSKAFPKLATKGRSYSIDELKGLEKYANERAVIIIPELDVPGHTSCMRKTMPELFGRNELSIIDISKPEVVKAVQTIVKEMLDIFYTSPYFHLGGDECWLVPFEKEDHVKKYIKEKGFDNAHDIYLDFIVQMNDFIKKCGKKTLVWESFPDKGSSKVQIPEDITVFAWETAYQVPQSLIKNGYTIINASWKPTYTTPGRRWSQKYIYNWNIRRWENHWNVTPSFRNPIQLNSNNSIIGGQMCAWEQNDYELVPSLYSRVPALSENLWNDQNKLPYIDFAERYKSTNAKLSRLLFPVIEKRNGFRSEDSYCLDHNLINNFGDEAEVEITPAFKDFVIRYTTDNSMPDVSSPVFNGKLILNSNKDVKYAIFDKSNQIVGYKSIKYVLSPLEVAHRGEICKVRDRNIGRVKENFDDELTIIISNLKKGSEVRYTLNGKNPTIDSKLYRSGVNIDKSLTFKAQCFVNGSAYGKMYECNYTKRDFEKNVTTDKPIVSNIKGEEHAFDTKLAVDGEVNINNYWGYSGKASLTVDLKNIYKLKEIVLYTFWDKNRYYQYTIDVSKDGSNWTNVVDRSKNTEKATNNGYKDFFNQCDVKYIRVNMLRNNSNPAMHIVEIRAY